MSIPSASSNRNARRFPTIRETLHVAPHGRAHVAAIQAFLAAVVPVAVLAAIDRIDLLPYALLVSVVSVYGRRSALATKLRMQGEALALQVFLLLAGTALSYASPSGWTVISLAALVAGAGTALSDVRRWTPPGAVFFVFAFAVASLSENHVSLVVAGGTAIGTALFTLAITVVLFPAARPSVPAFSPKSRTRWRLVLTHALVCVFGAGIAGGIAVWLGLPHPYWAAVSAIVPVMGVTTSGQTMRALHRVVGTFAGLGVSLLLFSWPLPQPVLLLVLVVVMACIELFVGRNYAVALLFLTPFTVGILFLNGPVDLPSELALRGVETVIGIAVALVFVLSTHWARHPSSPEITPV